MQDLHLKQACPFVKVSVFNKRLKLCKLCRFLAGGGSGFVMVSSSSATEVGIQVHSHQEPCGKLSECYIL
jgi:hypothetical protein